MCMRECIFRPVDMLAITSVFVTMGTAEPKLPQCATKKKGKVILHNDATLCVCVHVSQ